MSVPLRKSKKSEHLDPRPLGHIPLSCYRLQFSKSFTFRDACNILDYFVKLGITDIYASPLLQSRSGSGHGYDATDPTRIDSDLGSERQFEAFQADLKKHHLGLLLDIVPNHMAASAETPWWMDVLENGPASAYSSYFDVDWHPPSRMFDNKILLPVLGSVYADALENQELELIFRDGSFYIKNFDSLFPLAPKSYPLVLTHRQHDLERTLHSGSTAFQEYLGIIATLSEIPPREYLPGEEAGRRRLQVEAVKERLRKLYDSQPGFKSFLDSNIKIFNGKREDQASFQLLDQLLSEQAYVLSYWQNVNAEINYRRFFSITDLVGMRVEDPVVFDATHSIIFNLIERGAVTGLRIDHIDGLKDPLAYLRRVQGRASREPGKDATSQFYVIVEKILSGAEQLPSDWPAQGTTGYEYLNAVNRLFLHLEGGRAIEQIYLQFVKNRTPYQELLYEKKKLVMATLLAVEMRYLGRQLGILAEHDRYARDIPRTEVAQAIIEVTACLSVYRTYIREMNVSPEAKKYIESAVADARKRKPQIRRACFDFVRNVLLLEGGSKLFAQQREERLAFVMRWQQFTGPIVAKGLEDTALYVYCPLASLNEVGGDARPSAPSPFEFTRFIRDRQRRWPYGLNATTTHDTKRGEDVRARINVLSEIPDEWARHLNAWARWNASKKKNIDGQSVPDRNEEIFLYETLLGAWPLRSDEMPSFEKRMKEYVIKATREAMVHTRWTRPNTKHENRLTEFVAVILKPGKSNRFLAGFSQFQQKIAYFGMLNGLAQVLLKLTSPGVPDLYQGCELWDLRLVDPDNRGPVDFDLRNRLLEEIENTMEESTDGEFNKQLLHNWQDGRAKLFLTWKVLNLRRQHRSLFLDGLFHPLEVAGKRSKNLLAYARQQEKQWVLTVVPRLLAHSGAPTTWDQMADFWRDTKILLPAKSPGNWQNALSGESVETGRDRRGSWLQAQDMLKNFPVSCLRSQASAP
ncbi:MAG: malto-oligosyltrehalose synthase [Candidatus Acidiferrales bacterium]